MAKRKLAVRYRRFEGPPDDRRLVDYNPGDAIEIDDATAAAFGPGFFAVDVASTPSTIVVQPELQHMLEQTNTPVTESMPVHPVHVASDDRPATPVPKELLTPTFVTLPAAPSQPEPAKSKQKDKRGSGGGSRAIRDEDHSDADTDDRNDNW